MFCQSESKHKLETQEKRKLLNLTQSGDPPLNASSRSLLWRVLAVFHVFLWCNQLTSYTHDRPWTSPFFFFCLFFWSGAGHLCQRESVQQGDAGWWTHLLPRTGEQRLRVPRSGSGHHGLRSSPHIWRHLPHHRRGVKVLPKHALRPTFVWIFSLLPVLERTSCHWVPHFEKMIFLVKLNHSAHSSPVFWHYEDI